MGNVQLKGFRKILWLSTTFVNRTNTNKFVSERINEEVQRVRPSVVVKTVAEYYEDRKLKLGRRNLVKKRKPMRRSWKRRGGRRQPWRIPARMAKPGE